MLPRRRALRMVEAALAANPVCALVGPRQCGKTTLARQIASRRGEAHYFDLETAIARARLAEPELALSPLRGLVVLDEIQVLPGLFTVLRPLADRPRKPARFLILGSASPDLVRGVSESLAGRVAFVDLGGFALDEVGPGRAGRLWLRGGFPRSFLPASPRRSVEWRRDFIRTFLERDLPQLGIRIPAETLRRFWQMVAHYHGQIWSGAEFARSMGVSEHTVRRYVDILAGAYVLRQLPPWFENVGKRQYKSPKVYVRDSGLLHTLLSITSDEELVSHPTLGASWEGFALEQVLAFWGDRDAYYWRTHAGAELDLLVSRAGRRYGFEFKYSDAPRMTKSLHVALEDLKLERAWIVYPGSTRYAAHERVEVLPVAEIPARLGKPSAGARPAHGKMRSRRPT